MNNSIFSKKIYFYTFKLVCVLEMFFGFLNVHIIDPTELIGYWTLNNYNDYYYYYIIIIIMLNYTSYPFTSCVNGFTISQCYDWSRWKAYIWLNIL